MPPHDHSACEVGIGPDSIVELVAAGRGDQHRVDLEFHPVDRVTCEIGGRAWPPREELRFGHPLATTPDVLQEHAPGGLLIDSVSEEMGESGEVRFVAGVRDERVMVITVTMDRPIEHRHVMCTTAGNTTRAV